MINNSRLTMSFYVGVLGLLIITGREIQAKSKNHTSAKKMLEDQEKYPDLAGFDNLPGGSPSPKSPLQLTSPNAQHKSNMSQTRGMHVEQAESGNLESLEKTKGASRESELFDLLSSSHNVTTFDTSQEERRRKFIDTNALKQLIGTIVLNEPLTPKTVKEALKPGLTITRFSRALEKEITFLSEQIDKSQGSANTDEMRTQRNYMKQIIAVIPKA